MPSAAAGRAVEDLHAVLRDPSFRDRPGCPTGTVEALCALSDPPLYTACPNPFLSDLFKGRGSSRRDRPKDSSGKLFTPTSLGEQISAGKGEAIYRLPSYYTKVPPKAIEPLIEKHTLPNDVVLDPFCGSGMTGVAALRRGRRVVLVDLSPLATLIAHTTVNLTKAVSLDELDRLEAFAERAITPLYADAEGSVYDYAIWTERYRCPCCEHTGDLFDALIDFDASEIRESFFCPKCETIIRTRSVDRVRSEERDPHLGERTRLAEIRCRLLSYSDGRSVRRRSPTRADEARISACLSELGPTPSPLLPFFHLSHERNNLPGAWGITHLHHLYTPRNWGAIARWMEEGPGSRRLRLFVLSCIHENSASRRNRFYVDRRRPRGSPVGPLSNTLYVPSLQVEANLGKKLTSAIRAIRKLLKEGPPHGAFVSTGSAADMSNIPEGAVQYIFTDPPFGANINYSEQSYLLEHWMGARTASDEEAITSSAQKKGPREYQAIMTRALRACRRVLAPNGALTLAFNNTSDEVWRALQSAIETAGFEVREVALLDKQAYSLHQDEKSNVVNKDLLITATKPTRRWARAGRAGLVEGKESVWRFVSKYLEGLTRGELVLAEDAEVRTPKAIYEHLVTAYIVRGRPVPLSMVELKLGLLERFVEDNGRFYLGRPNRSNEEEG